MKKHLVNDSKLQYCKSIKPNYFNFVYKEWRIMLGLHLVLVTLQINLQLELNKTNRIDDTKHNI